MVLRWQIFISALISLTAAKQTEVLLKLLFNTYDTACVLWRLFEGHLFLKSGGVVLHVESKFWFKEAIAF